MTRGRPLRCPYEGCGSTKIVSKGIRKTKTMGNRKIRYCKDCGRKFTPKKKTLLPFIVKPFDTIKQAMSMMVAVEKLLLKVKRFFHSILLLGYSCPKCNGLLNNMIKEGICQCDSCKYEFDPTVEFQRCSKCGGRIKLRVRRYQCQKCGADVTSRFLFEGLVFDTDYFWLKVAESRQR